MKIPYQLTAAVAVEQRYVQMTSAIARANARGWRRLDQRPIDPTATLSIAAYGPSLKDTWQDLKHPILSMSGATKFLADRGITPTWHCDMDPRGHKAMTSLPPWPGVTYLVASVCPPEYFDALEAAGADVVLWHTVSSTWEADLRWVSAQDPGELVVSSGSTIGLAALQLAGLLGFNRFEIHGMDGSFVDGQRHAGPHAGKRQPDTFTWDAGGVTYRTSQIMANGVAETINTITNSPVIAVFHGRGLTQALIREANIPNACCADETDKRAALAQRRVNVLQAPAIPKGKHSVWDGMLACLEPEDVPALIGHIGVCEPRREKATYNTGSIPLETAVLLRALCRYYQPRVVAEIGTFIGTSALALEPSAVIYTCDRSNDCVPSGQRIKTHPYQSSTDMLTAMSEPVDLFFVDGRLRAEDLPEILRLSHPKTVYAFDDHTGHEKGVINATLLAPHIPTHVLVSPYAPYGGRSTLSAMLPMGHA